MLRNWVCKLERFYPLTSEERAGLLRVVTRTRVIETHQDVVSAGEQILESYLIVDGFACDYKILPEGSRQIISFRVPGDFCALESLLTKRLDHHVEAMGRTTVAVIPHQSLLSLGET